MKKDTLYQQTEETVKPFEFDQRVVDVFPDMIKRSVPGYPMTLAMTSVIADRYFQDGTTIYDLGCSLGAVTFVLDQSLTEKDGKLVGVDNSEAMINQCEAMLATYQNQFDIEFMHADINDVEMHDASVVVMNFTLQFVPLEQRLSLLQRIHASLLPGGVLIVSEKIQFEDAGEQGEMQELHHHMKAMNGYDAMEIANKREALEKVLIPETLAMHIERLQQAGFSNVYPWLRCLNFVSLLATK